jgi:putative polyhydroxyalkanoate system protein
MSTIDITREHALAKDEARKRAEELAKSLQSKFNLVWRWEGDAIHFDAPSGPAKGTKGEVLVNDTNVRVQIDLPFLLRMLKGTVESKVHEKLQQLL